MALIVEKRNSEVFLRPRFSIELPKNHLEVIEDFKRAFQSEQCNCIGKIVDGHIYISVPKAKDHFWSPQLHLEILEQEDNTSLLKGLFGPKPQVWTLFMFVHFIVGTSFLGFAILLYTRWSLDKDIVFPLVMLILLPMVWIILYFLGKIGKSTGKSQMVGLHDFMLKVIAED